MIAASVPLFMLEGECSTLELDSSGECLAHHNTLPAAAVFLSAGITAAVTGIFMIEASGKYAVLKAASSEGGQRMLARNHRLMVGEEGIVGLVASLGKSRVSHISPCLGKLLLIPAKRAGPWERV
jgi:hypothetical protein